MESMELGKYNLRTDSLCSEKIAEFVEEAYDRRKAIQEQLTEMGNFYRSKLHAFTHKITNELLF